MKPTGLIRLSDGHWTEPDQPKPDYAFGEMAWQYARPAHRKPYLQLVNAPKDQDA